MGSAQSSQDHGEEDEEERDEDAESLTLVATGPKEKVLEQEPEILPCRASASPLSPQLSAAGTPRLLGPSIKIWDPCNVLLPPSVFSRLAEADAGCIAEVTTEVVLINHGECGVSLRPDLIGGRWPASSLTGNGERQARALAVLLNSQGMRFNAVYSSPLDRARATAAIVCRELGFAEEQIQSSDALVEISQGQWEGCLRSEVYNTEMVSLIDRTQPDFSPPLGESLRQVEFRMIEFLSRTVLRIPEKLLSGEPLMNQNEVKGLSRHSSTGSVHDKDAPHWDFYRLNRPGIQRKKSGKSRLQFMTTGEHENEEEFSPIEASHVSPIQCSSNSNRNATTSVGIFTHATPIKCLVACLLGCNPAMSMKICIDDSSVTLLLHSLRKGWQIKRLNDTSHLRLL
ncbi:putative phosphoglycerate mutase [Apostasia shenzhenica]|uniref:Putative phosphoglycerate mutase n=1 Tax=Apostasia shenzhenica TaxID=1088818 RepID=A0A2I0B971_9ASPA|nr:putative phosphoglycerate mutase [Apostasia shenzhenica]